ncbi:MAG: leucine--tRNA ligase [Candidatus Moraniibacteriota bacterium]
MKTSRYNPKKIEAKWQKYWLKNETYRADLDSSRKKFYALVEFPFPSGDGLHTGHIRGYTAMDIIARKRRLEGYNVLFPIGWDAFGLPTENYAIKTGLHPAKVTKQNTDTFRKQLRSVGLAFDWSREINTTDPEYYRWTQWIFLQLFKKGLAYKAKMEINWCPSCKIGLANEEAQGGVCERCGGPIEKREKEQWMLAITKYADRLDQDLDTVDYWEKIKIQQRNWIGRSEGMIVKFSVIASEARQSPNDEGIATVSASGRIPRNDSFLEVFTTRVDTIYGCTYVVVAPEHEILKNKELGITNQAEIQKYIDTVKKITEQDRLDATKEKTGVKIEGIEAINPFAGESVPIFVADYVLGNYGTGAVMAVPAHDERDLAFAKKYELPIKISIQGNNFNDEGCFTEDGVLVNSGEFSDLKSEEAREKMVAWLEERDLGKKQVNFKLRDWVFSRQRYWGEPIPMVFCPSCAKATAGEENSGWVPLPESELPLKLPKVKSYIPTDTGESPLAVMKKWVNTKCPVCGGKATRETDTMPNWAGSSWYYLRYTDPKNAEALASQEALKYWMGCRTESSPARPAAQLCGVDWYNGGMEHTTLHLLYSRFWHKFLFDIGVVPTSEPYMKRTSHGLILAEGGVKMSKSKGNVVNPDSVVRDFGADTLRVYEMFMGPFDQPVAWSMESISGSRRFLEKVWKLQGKVVDGAPLGQLARPVGGGSEKCEMLLHQTIKKVSEDIEAMRFNTAISSLMILVNEWEKEEMVEREMYEKFLILLSPFAPHIAEELWQVLGNEDSLFTAQWPVANENYLVQKTAKIIVQVNGKLRASFDMPTDANETDVRAQAEADGRVAMYLTDKTIRKVIFVPNRLINFVVG